MQYNRVIPRDFFNEAKLLNCMGWLSLKIHDNELPEGVRIVIEGTGKPFEISLTSDGRLFVKNYEVFVNDTYVSISTTYNSKAKYPLLCYHDDIETTVFDEEGNFTEEFIAFGRSLE